MWPFALDFFKKSGVTMGEPKSAVHKNLTISRMLFVLKIKHSFAPFTISPSLLTVITGFDSKHANEHVNS